MAIGSTNVRFLNLSTPEGASSTYRQRDDSSRPKVLIFGTRDKFLKDSRKKNIIRNFIDVTSFSVLNEDISSLIFSRFPMLAGKETSLSSRTSGDSYLIHQRPTISTSENYLMQLRATKTSRDNYMRQHRSTITSGDSYLVSHRRYEVEDFIFRASPDNKKNNVNKQRSEKVPKFVNGKYHKVLEGVNLLKLANSPNNDLTGVYFQGASRHLIKRDSGLITVSIYACLTVMNTESVIR